MNDLLDLILILVYLGGVIDNHPSGNCQLTGWQLHIAVLKAYIWPLSYLLLTILFFIGIAFATLGIIFSKKYRDKFFDKYMK